MLPLARSLLSRRNRYKTARIPPIRSALYSSSQSVKSSISPVSNMPRGHAPAKKPPLTHFVCIPLLTPTSIPQLKESLQSFKDAVSSPERTVTIPEKAFRPLGVLHLTLGVMSLTEASQLEAAKTLLRSLNLQELLQAGPEAPHPSPGDEKSASLTSLSRAITPPPLSKPNQDRTPLVVTLEGLQAFPSPSKATVLHLPPHDPTSRLYPFCHRLRQAFVDAGFVQPEDRPLVLHATIVNTVYAKTDRRGEKRRMGRITFDATGLMERYDGLVWASGVEIEGVRICEMGARAMEVEGGGDGDEGLGQEYTAVMEKRILDEKT